MGVQSFSRSHRFTGLAAFAPVLRAGRRVRSTEMAAAVMAGRPGASRLGVVLPKRTAPKATTRNRMKRIAREVFRCHPVRTAGLDLILLPRAAFGRADARQWAAAVRSLLCRVGQ